MWHKGEWESLNRYTNKLELLTSHYLYILQLNKRMTPLLEPGG